MPTASRPPRLAAVEPAASRWASWLPVILLVLDLVAEAVVPDAISSGFLLTALPVLTAFSYGPALTATATAGSLTLQLILATRTGHVEEQHHIWVYIATLISGLMGTALSWQRTRQNLDLLHARTIAETLQRTVLRPVPERPGGLRVAGLYRPAQADVLVGGDLYEVCDTRFGVRILLGDVRGKGLGAVRTVADVLGAFRATAYDTPGLVDLADQLDRAVLRDAADRGDDELFVTAVLLQYRQGSDCVEIVNRGHTTPLLLGGGSIAPISCADELPLGLGHLGPTDDRSKAITVALPPGHTVLLYTDGVSEARDTTGAFYPLAPRLATLGSTTPDRVVSFLAQDVHNYAGLLADDLALLALTRDLSR
ncbi:PP2C family protein-serine/threonine phosphatase [Kitasatospora brasiliensis]|uniref:PP2C family protein-serine/threonine phosphatase n=1 Tax=Kitasatospora brasiliensis TaxID=3058040 RepID=UPI0029308179|nr:PP2C family protein-serine/threonine phosphatase [Kitasatospora sp. K002]